MAAIVSSARAAFALLAVALLLRQGAAQAPTCAQQLEGLAACAPFVVPGAALAAPNSQCCSSLQAVEQSCICSTLEIVTSLPSQCSLASISCAARNG